MYELTVIVTVYNIAKYLPRFFESMFAQSYRNFILLMVDDGSTDESLKICNDYSNKDDRIRVLSLEHVGIAKARNIAMNYIETPLTAYADGDDYVDPDYIFHLVSALKRNEADLVISRVAYHTEGSDHIDGVFKSRGEMCIEKKDFSKNLPMLLDDRRLNYLYAKVYKSELLKNIRVEDNVRQGSDTMINCQYILKANRIVLIDDVDYHYIKYNNRSVTSYSGGDAYKRICRINTFVYDIMRKNGYLTEEMISVIDSRVLQSAIWVIEKILCTDTDFSKKANQISEILQSNIYAESYARQKDNLKSFSFDSIPPQSGQAYLKSVEKKRRSLCRRAKILSFCPTFLVNVYHKLKRNK